MKNRLSTGQLIRAARTARGLNQMIVARDAGMSPGRLSLFENELRDLSDDRVERLIAAIGIDDEDLDRLRLVFGFPGATA